MPETGLAPVLSMMVKALPWAGTKPPKAERLSETLLPMVTLGALSWS